MRGNAPVRLFAVYRVRLASSGWLAVVQRSYKIAHYFSFVNSEFAKCRKFFFGLSARHANTAAAPVQSARARRPVPPWHDSPFAALRRVIFCANMTRGMVYTLTAADVTSTGAVITFQSVSFFQPPTKGLENTHKHCVFPHAHTTQQAAADTLRPRALYIVLHLIVVTREIEHHNISATAFSNYTS